MPQWGTVYVTSYRLDDVMNYTGGTMTTQMRIEQADAGWVVMNGVRPVAINGITHYPERDELVSEIEARKLFVWSDGSIAKEVEGGLAPSADSQPGYTPEPAPPTQDPPTDPNADPDDPDPNPTVPKKDPEPKKKSGRVKLTADIDKLVEEAVKTGEGLSVAGKAKRAQMLDAEEKPKRTRKPKDAPRFDEEQKKRRAEYAKQYRANMTEEQKEAQRQKAKERQARWREKHPDKVAEYAQRSSERRKKRYNEDEDYREKYRMKQKEYAAQTKAS
jgi:hypothetical protein